MIFATAALAAPQDLEDGTLAKFFQQKKSLNLFLFPTEPRSSDVIDEIQGDGKCQINSSVVVCRPILIPLTVLIVEPREADLDLSSEDEDDEDNELLDRDDGEETGNDEAQVEPSDRRIRRRRCCPTGQRMWFSA